MTFKPTHTLTFSKAFSPRPGRFFDKGDEVEGMLAKPDGRSQFLWHLKDGSEVTEAVVWKAAPLQKGSEPDTSETAAVMRGRLAAGTKDTNPKDAVGSRKIPWHVLPWRVLAGVVLAFFGGALKYRAFNYRIAGVRATVYIDAAIRHILRFAEGEDWDPDVKGYNKEDPSKGVLIHHLDEAIAGLMVLRDSMLIGNWTDDRAPSISPGWIDEANEMAGRIIDANPNPQRNWTQAEVVKARAVAAGVAAFDAGDFAPEGSDATWFEEVKEAVAANVLDLGSSMDEPVPLAPEPEPEPEPPLVMEGIYPAVDPGGPLGEHTKPRRFMKKESRRG